jgi:hypothetical protein
MRAAVAGLLSFLLILALVGPVAARPPVGQCPNPFEPMDYDAFRAHAISLGFPESAEAALEAYFADNDTNNDGTICVRDAPAQNQGGVLLIAIDNIARR